MEYTARPGRCIQIKAAFAYLARMYSSTIPRRRVWLFTLFVLFFTCSEKKTQRELYEDTVSGLTYRTYKATSGTTLGPAVKLYNEQRPDSLAPLDPAYAHLLLGYGWTVSAKPAMAFAEADLAAEEGDATVKYLAQSLRSITMYEQGWDSLAHEESQQAKKHRLLKPDASAQYEAAVFYMLMGLASAYDKDFAQSKFYWAGFANETAIHWPYKLTDAIDDLQNQRIQAGLIKLKALSQDPDVPPALQQALGQQIASIETKAGDVNSRLFWPKVISVVVLDQLKTYPNSQLGAVVRVLENLRKKV